MVKILDIHAGKRDHISFLQALNHCKYGTFQTVTYPYGLYSSVHLNTPKFVTLLCWLNLWPSEGRALLCVLPTYFGVKELRILSHVIRVKLWFGEWPTVLSDWCCCTFPNLSYAASCSLYIRDASGVKRCDSHRSPACSVEVNECIWTWGVPSRSVCEIKGGWSSVKHNSGKIKHIMW